MRRLARATVRRDGVAIMGYVSFRRTRWLTGWGGVAAAPPGVARLGAGCESWPWLALLHDEEGSDGLDHRGLVQACAGRLVHPRDEKVSNVARMN